MAWTWSRLSVSLLLKKKNSWSIFGENLFHCRLVAPFCSRPTRKKPKWPESILVPHGRFFQVWPGYYQQSEIFKVNGNTTTENKIMTIRVQHLQTGLSIFAQLLIWKKQTCETDSPCFFFFFSSVFWSAPLLITWQGHRRRLSGLIHGLPAAIFWFVSERAISRGSVHSCRLIVGEPCGWSDTATALCRRSVCLSVRLGLSTIW